MLHAAKTERGWELADETGTFEDESQSEVFSSKKLAEDAAKKANHAVRGFDELSTLERQYD